MRIPVAAAVGALLLAAACRTVSPPAEPARTADRALEELPADAFPSFADDLDYAGLDDALERSLAHLSRLATVDPGRTLAFG
ncbi:MAG TPA: transglycosylase, partial [Anaeromyxobacter sp.]|nr:transglycosylase [Anaeromyxobacter sp.]